MRIGKKCGYFDFHSQNKQKEIKKNKYNKAFSGNSINSHTNVINENNDGKISIFL